jgi:hypothetical protein
MWYNARTTVGIEIMSATSAMTASEDRAILVKEDKSRWREVTVIEVVLVMRR